jgi:integrase
MNKASLWIDHPAAAYREWQTTEASGADRRPFSARSITQHTAMFERFLRHLVTHQATLINFGAQHLESFFAHVDNRCAPGTTTRLRYVKLIDRLCRHLVVLELRRSNPAAEFLRHEAWPEDEPVPLFLSDEADLLLQAHTQPLADDVPRAVRNRAIVALLLGTGVTAAEIRAATHEHLVIDATRPHIHVPRRGARDERKVTLAAPYLAALLAWQAQCMEATPTAWLFPAPRGSGPINDMLLGMIVREALDAIGFSAPDMSPRVLRNTYARRQLLAGRSNEDVSRLLGLTSQRTVVRLRATLPASEACE